VNETSVDFQRTTRRDIPENETLLILKEYFALSSSGLWCLVCCFISKNVSKERAAYSLRGQ
jgi:hypothetical protein